MSERRGLIASVVAGYGRSGRPEQVAFGMTSSFAATIAAARAFTYAQERHRRMPAIRSVGRRLAQVTGSNQLRVHHSLPGLLLAFTAGGASLLTGSHSRERWLAVPFGIGSALTTDELRLLAGRNNPYWGGRVFALTQCACAAVPAVVMGLRFARRGRGANERDGRDRVEPERKRGGAPRAGRRGRRG